MRVWYKPAGEAMTLNEWWGARAPRSAAARYVLYAAALIVVIVVGLFAVRRLTGKPADDCNKPAAPVAVPKAPAGLIVDAPCTDGSVPAKDTPRPSK
jgi:hypothetical protein